jgi:phage tail-like protein
VRLVRNGGRPVAASIAFDHDGDCGIFNVGTLEDARGRGYGTAVTAAQLRDGRVRGCVTATLQSTQMAERVYTRLGFQDLGRILEYRTGADFTSHKLPGRTTWGNLVLSHGITKDAELWNWRRSVVEGVTQRRNGTITLLDDSLNAVLRWRFVDGWPCKWDGPALDASKNEVAIESLEIAHEGLSLVT